MDGDSPVLTERKDIKTWKRLAALDKAASKGSSKNVEKLRKEIQRILEVDGYVNPKIIVKVIELVDLYLTEELQMILLEILEKCDLTECAPQLMAAGKLVAIGSYDTAKLILDRMTVISDVPQWEYLRGIVDVHESNFKSARKHFTRVLELDDRFLPAYDELEKIEPDKGWFCRGMIASIMNGEASISQSSGNNGRYGELYNVYWGWKNGDVSTAIDMVKRIVREGIETDVELAMARFYLEDRKNHEAIEHYRKAAESNMFYIKMEMAEAYLRIGNPAEALNICNELEGRSISDRRLVELQIRVVTALKDRAGMVKYAKVLLYNDYADYKAYVMCVKSYIDLQMHSEATGLLEEMSEMDDDDPMINLLLSKNDYMSGRYPSASVTAKKALKKMPEDEECLLHISRVYIARGRSDKTFKASDRYFKKALKYIREILERDPNDRDALLLEKEVYESSNPPEYEKAKTVCKMIIKQYPKDSKTLRDLAVICSKMNNDKEALTYYRESLEIMEDPTLFMEIVTSLAKTGKYEDVVEVANDYESTYGDIVDMWAIKGNAEYAIGNYEDAIRSFAKAVEMDFSKPVLWHSKGMAEEKAGEYDSAEISYDKAVLMDLDNPNYWISKAAVQEKKGDYPGAITSLNRVIAMHPENVYSLMRKATILVRLGKNGEARSFIDLAAKIEPLNMKILLARRDIYSKEGDTEATKMVCKTILSMNPSDKKTAIILAHMDMNTGDMDEACSVLVRLNIDEGGFSDDDYEIHHMLREIYHSQGRTHEEISTCKTILSFRPDDRATKVALAEAYIKRNMIDAAKILYDELHQQSPDDSGFSLKKAKMAGDKDSALSVLMESLTTDPDNKDVLLEVSRMLYEDDRLKDALVYVNRAIDSDPSDSEVYVRKILILSRMGNHRGVLAVAEEASSNVQYMNPLVWKLRGDSQMVIGDYSNALISYDTAMKLGINTRDVYHSRGMCQEVSGMDEAAINSYTIAYQKDAADTDSMIRVAAIYLKQGKDQMAGRELDKAISVDPICRDAILPRATIYASRGNEIGLKRLFDQCVTHGVDEYTRERVVELMEKVKAKEVVAMPIIELRMPEPPVEQTEESEPEEEQTSDVQSDETVTDEQPAEETSEAENDERTEGSEEPESPAEPEDEEPEEDFQDGFMVDDDSESGFVVVSSYDEEEEPAKNVPVIENEPAAIPEIAREEPAVVVQEAVSEEPESEIQVEPETKEDVELQVEEEPVIIPEIVQEEPESEAVVESEEEPTEGPVDEKVSEVQSAPDGEQPKKEQTVRDHAISLLKYIHDTGDVPSDDRISELAGIPQEKVKEVMDYLGEIEEFGTIRPEGREFEDFEDMSYEVIVGTGEDDIEDDPVIPLASAMYDSGANDIETAKRLVAYVYEAMTCEMVKEPFSMRVSDIADEVEFNGMPDTVYGIMAKYHIGVYSARMVKKLVFKDDGSVISHI
ncbi:MAG: tetratricopeptide repeat protein [Candidatus Methanomethylophilaceae archaeon]|nr:tetratricopeptide repeat protein [Candidatus Methanomethylophilaceae archaeon]